MKKDSGQTCEDCRHKKVCVVMDLLKSAIHDEGVLESSISELLSVPDEVTDRAQERLDREGLYHDIDLALWRAFGKSCPQYSHEPEGEKIPIEKLKEYLGDIKVEVPNGVLKSLTRKARKDVQDYACDMILFNDDPEQYERPTFIPAVLLPYLAMGAAKEASDG